MLAHSPHHPIWNDICLPRTEPLAANINCEVCVVGGGIAGLLIAERLHREGVDVVVLERSGLGTGETKNSTAHLVTALDDRYVMLERIHGPTNAKHLGESHAAAIAYIERLVQRLTIECGWERLDGYLVVNERHRSQAEQLLRDEFEACRRAGIDAQRVQRLPESWPIGMGPALRFSRQAQFHPLRFVLAVTQHLLAAWVRIYTDTTVAEIQGGSNATVTTRDHFKVKCRHVVVATHTPIDGHLVVHTRQAGYETYVMAFRVPPSELQPILLWDGLWEDDDSYRYVRLAKSKQSLDTHDIMIAGGEDHKVGQPPADHEPYRRIEEWVRSYFPMCGDIVCRWSGEIMESVDGVASIGRSVLGHPNVYVVTGDSGNGITHAGIAAHIIPDLILERENTWTSLYSPTRLIPLKASGDLVRENVNALSQYRDWIRPGDVVSEAEINPGSGAVLSKGLTRLAVYKDQAGQCTRLNAMCPHLKGVVRWNSVEQTWDCPCHGSRFDRYGNVIHGPANQPLTKIDHDAPSESM